MILSQNKDSAGSSYSLQVCKQSEQDVDELFEL